MLGFGLVAAEGAFGWGVHVNYTVFSLCHSIAV